MVKLAEPNLFMVVRECDKTIAQSIIPYAMLDYTTKTGANCNLTLASSFLPVTRFAAMMLFDILDECVSVC